MTVVNKQTNNLQQIVPKDAIKFYFYIMVRERKSISVHSLSAKFNVSNCIHSW